MLVISWYEKFAFKYISSNFFEFPQCSNYRSSERCVQRWDHWGNILRHIGPGRNSYLRIHRLYTQVLDRKRDTFAWGAKGAEDAASIDGQSLRQPVLPQYSTSFIILEPEPVHHVDALKHSSRKPFRR